MGSPIDENQNQIQTNWIQSAKMSHANVTVTRTVTTTHPTAIFLNVGYLKSASGLLKIGQLILGGIVIALILIYGDYYSDRYIDYSRWYIDYSRNALLCMLVAAVTFFICTFILLLSCIFSLSTGGLISKTLYEFIYHMFAAILLFTVSVIHFLKIKDREYEFKWYLNATIACFANFVLYLISTVLAFREYRY